MMGLSIEERVRETADIPRKKIALINPPASFLTDDQVFFSLGLLNIAAVARDAGHDVTVVDLAGRSDYEAQAANLVGGGYDIYGLTSTSPQFSYASRILEALKGRDPNAYVVVGGPHASMFANLRETQMEKIRTEYGHETSNKVIEAELHRGNPNYSSLERFDLVVSGEEGGIFEVIKRQSTMDRSKKWVDGGITSDLDSLPNPARDLIDMAEYTYQDNGKPKFDFGGGPATSVMSQRGCPYKCNFCSGREVAQYRQVKIGGTWRVRSPRVLIGELDEISGRDQGITSFMIYDDELNLNEKMFGSLMEALTTNNHEREESGLQAYTFRGFMKSDLFVKHPKQAVTMKAAGFRELLSGFESGDDYILTNRVNKKTTRKINLRASQIAFEAGLDVKALTMIGHPGETRETVDSTRTFLEEASRMAQEHGQRLRFDVTILSPMPGSPIYDGFIPNTGDFSEFGLVSPDRSLYMHHIDFAEDNSGGAYKTGPEEEMPTIRTPELSGAELMELRKEVDRSIREEFKAPTYYSGDSSENNSIEDTEHSMGMMSPPRKKGSE